MPFSLIRLVDAAHEIFSVDEVKRHCRIFISADDDYIADMLIPSARLAAELYLNRALQPEKYRLTLDRFPGSWPYTYGYGMVQSPKREIHIPIGPLISIDSFVYPDPQTLEPVTLTGYQLVIAEPARLQPQYGTAWPIAAWTIGDIHIEFTSGYRDDQASPVVGTQEIPVPIKLAMLMIIGHWYNNRESQEIPKAAENLLQPYRMWDLAPVANNWGRFDR